LADTIRQSRLDNGIRVVTEDIAASHAVTMGFWVDAGSRDEDPAQAGASHFLEHLLFKGTAERSARQIAEAVDAVGGDMNAFTTKEYTAYYMRLIEDDLDLGLDILSDIMWAPAFRPEEIDAERQVILEEILMHEDEPSDLVHELMHEALFPEHPLGREVLGDKSTITAMTRDQIDDYFRSHYRPSSMVVAAAGSVDHQRLVEGVAARFAGGDGEAPARVIPPLAAPQRMVVRNRPTEQAHIMVGMRALDRNDGDRFALSILNHVLGGGMSSRLFQEVREKRGLAYSVYSYRVGYLESGMLGIYAGTSPSRAHEVLDLIGDELDRLAAEGIPEQELEQAKGHLRGSLALSLEDSAGRMSRIGRSRLVHDEVMTYEDLVERVDSVTAEDVMRVGARVLGGERALAVVGPFQDDAFESVGVLSRSGAPPV